MAGDLDPRRLLIFRAVLQAGSISAGARALGWSQPAVTGHINTLERAAGSPLLLRSPAGVAPTQAGAALAAHADAIAGHLDAAKAELAELNHLRGGRVRLVAFPSALAAMVPHAIARLRAVAGPGLAVQLSEAEPPQALAAVAAGQADLALVFEYPEDAERAQHAAGLWSVPIADDAIELVLPAECQAAGRAGLALADLAGERWVAGCPRCREHLVACCRAAGFSPDIRHETDDYVVVQALVGQGLAVSALPATALAAYRNPRVVTRALPELTGRTILAACRAGAQTVPSVAAAIDALQTP
jgi:molybdate transport repressor ModE-like protein